MAKNNALNNDISNCSGLPPAGISVGANSAMIVTDSSGVASATSSMTDGQVVVGSTGATPTAATLTAGSGISITNGAGAITIAASGGGGSGGLINVQYLTTSGTYTATAGTVSCLVIVVAGGGGGGGTFGRAATAGPRFYSSYGGQGSGYGQKYYSTAPTGTAYTIGAGGAGGIATGLAGSTEVVQGDAGGESTFNAGDIVIKGAGGGGGATTGTGGGNNQYPVMNTSVGSASGVGNNADITANGGYAGFIRGGTGSGGSGGGSIFGMGAGGVNTNTNGIDAVCYGSGGGGTAVIAPTGGTSPTNDIYLNGGSGAPGIIVVWEYGA